MNISHSSVISLGKIPALLRLYKTHMICAAFLQCLMELLAPRRADSFIILLFYFFKSFVRNEFYGSRSFCHNTQKAARHHADFS